MKIIKKKKNCKKPDPCHTPHSAFLIKTSLTLTPTWALSQVLFLAFAEVIRNFLLSSFFSMSSFSYFPSLVLLFIWRGAGIIGAAATGEVSQVIWSLTSWRLTAFWHGGQRLVKIGTYSNTKHMLNKYSRKDHFIHISDKIIYKKMSEIFSYCKMCKMISYWKKNVFMS